MRKSVITLLALLVCGLLPLHAYEYFTIYFSDGTKSNAFYATDVDSICYSKIGLDSIEYTDWQVQEIYTCDSIYRYPLAQIDSLSFTDMNIDKVKEEIEQASNAIIPLFLQSSSVDEMASHLSSIAKIDEVEEAWIDGQALFVKTNEGGLVTFLYPPKRKNSNVSLSKCLHARQDLPHFTQSVSGQSDYKSLCIVNQFYNARQFDIDTELKDTLRKDYQLWGINVDIVNVPTLDFYRNDIFNYDMVLLDTHGVYNSKNNLHWLLTGEKVMHAFADYEKPDSLLEKLTKWDNYWAKTIFQYKYGSPKNISFFWVRDSLSNGRWQANCYVGVSESFIGASTRAFNNYGKAIVFNAACESLKGKSEERPDFALANILFRKGVGCYLGYTDTNTIGGEAGFHFFEYLLYGKSVFSAYNNLWRDFPDLCEQKFTLDGKEYHPLLLGYRWNDNTLRLTIPKTLSVEEIEKEGSKEYILSGQIKTFNQYPGYAEGNKYGFLVADNPDMEQPIKTINPVEGTYDPSSINMKWGATLNESDLQPNTTYYYCAYMFDGYNYCYGEVREMEKAEPYVVRNDSILTFYYDSHRRERFGTIIEDKYGGDYPDYVFPKWSRTGIKQAVIDSSFIHYTPTSTAYWFSYLRDLTEIKGLENINTEKVTDMQSMFTHCSSLKKLDLSGFHTSNVINMRGMFDDCSSLKSISLVNFDTSNVTSMGIMFLGCSSLENLDLSNFNTSKVTTMKNMFNSCSSLESLDLSNFDTKNVIDFEQMFGYCRSLVKIDISNFVISGSANAMFAGCLSLTNIIFRNGKSKVGINSGMFHYYAGSPEISEFPPLYIDMENFDASGLWCLFFEMNNIVEVNLTRLHTDSIEMCTIAKECPSLKKVNMTSFNSDNLLKAVKLFIGCNSLESVDMSNLNVSNLEILGGVFDFLDCDSLKYINLSNLNAPSLKTIPLFKYRSSLRIVDLCNINAPNLKDISFSGDVSLERIYVDNTWNNVNLNWNGYMFSECSSLVGGQGTKIGNNLYGYSWSGEPLYYYCPESSESAHIDGGKDNPGLFTAR